MVLGGALREKSKKGSLGMTIFISVILQLFYFNLQGNHWLLSSLAIPLLRLSRENAQLRDQLLYLYIALYSGFIQVFHFPCFWFSWHNPNKAKTRDREVKSHQVCSHPSAPWACPPAGCFLLGDTVRAGESEWASGLREVQIWMASETNLLCTVTVIPEGPIHQKRVC